MLRAGVLFLATGVAAGYQLGARHAARRAIRGGASGIHASTAAPAAVSMKVGPPFVAALRT